MNITKLPEPILGNSTKKVDVNDIKNGTYRDLISDMLKAMKDNKGVGLAANQVDLDLSIFVIDPKLAQEHNVPEVYFNAEITEYSSEKDELEEGCLSIPNFYSPILRSKKIKLKAVDKDGKRIKIKARGFLARVLQHETDHLNGITIKNR